MDPETESARARRYLLDEASDVERSALEHEYFQHEDAVDRIAAAEDDLIEEYLSNGLAPAERAQFERVYLSVPHRRQRVETVRRLMAAAARHAASEAPSIESPQPATFRLQWLALAAALVLVAAGAFWVSAPSRDQRAAGAVTQSSTAATPPEPVPAPPPSSPPQVFAASISPVTVRSAAASPSVIIPAGTEVLALSLEGGGDGPKLVAGRASIRSMNGGTVWEGRAAAGEGRPPGVIARLDLPAARLPADDYVITLFGTDPSGAEQEWSRYFLSVRADSPERRR